MKESGLKGTIQHDGTVRKVDGNSVLVSITSNASCSGCHAEGLCGITGKEEKIVDIRGSYNVSPGDQVTVLMDQSAGLRAVALSYVIPLVIVVASLVILNLLSFRELTAGLVSISMLFPWFLILHFFRDRISRNFTFTIKT